MSSQVIQSVQASLGQERSTSMPIVPINAPAPERLRRVRQFDTAPELAVRSQLHAQGLRYRVNYRVGSGRSAPRPDIVFTRQHVAVFIDGCFWHQCPEHATMPKANRDFWEPKLRRNVERDRENDAALEEMGWTVLRFWEHEDPNEVAKAIIAVIRPSPG